MNKQIIIQLLSFLLLILSEQAFPGTSLPEGDLPPAGKGSLEGKVLHKQTKEPIEYATVVLFSLPDTSMFNGTVSNPDGIYLIENIPFGRYYLKVNFIGFNLYSSAEIIINQENKFIQLPAVLLEPANISLEGIEVVADRSPIEYRIDKKVVNVSQDILASGGTAVDVLENTPSVEVDIEGNVALRGSGNFTVLIDGRPSVLEGSEALQQIPASTIENIEIITNPSAKYDPEGTAGIINVVTKKRKQSGLSGVVNASIGTKDKYEGDFLVNYRKNNVNLYGGMDFHSQHYPGNRETYREAYQNDTTYFLEQDGTRNRNRKGIGGRLGLDWNLSDQAVFGIAMRYGEFNSGWDRHLESKEWIVPDTLPVQYYVSEEDGPRRSKYFSTDLYFKQQLDTLGQKLEINVFLAGRDGNDEENTKEWNTDAHWNKQGDPVRYINTLEKENARQIQNKLDYTKPFRNNAILEAGLLTDHSNDNEDYIFGQIPASEIPDYSNKMKFRQDIYAAYLTFSHQLFGFEYLLGLRGEYTHRVITSEQAGLDYTIDQPDYFPSFHISRKLKKDHQLYASYSRRIDRPGGRQLEPFTYYRDANNRWRGNPDLIPEYINSYELGWLKKWKGSFMSLEGFYKNTKNLISRVSEASEGNVITHTFINMNQDHSLGGEAMISLEALKWLSLNLMGSVYYYELEGELNGIPLNEFSTTWNTRMNASIKLKSATRFEIRTTYRGPSVTAQGSREGTFTADAAVRQDFLKRSLSAVLQVKDIFGSLKYEITSSEENVFYEHTRFTMEPQVFILTLSYKFNNFQLRKDDPGEPGNSESGMDISY